MENQSQVWLVESTDQRLGTVYKMEKGYVFAHQGISDYFSSKPKLEEFIRSFGEYRLKPLFPHGTTKKENHESVVHGYPAQGPTYNHLLHVKHRAPVYTQEANSKCFYAAGWYAVDYGTNSWHVEFCPKLLVLNRNKKHEQPQANLNLAPIDSFNNLLAAAERKNEREIKITLQNARQLSYAINQLLTKAVNAFQDRENLTQQVGVLNAEISNPTVEVDGGKF
jgi:hypothetical protein